MTDLTNFVMCESTFCRRPSSKQHWADNMMDLSSKRRIRFFPLKYNWSDSAVCIIFKGRGISNIQHWNDNMMDLSSKRRNRFFPLKSNWSDSCVQNLKKRRASST